MINFGPVTLTLGVPTTVPNAPSSVGNPPTSVQIDNTTAFTLRASCGGTRYLIQAFWAVTIPCASGLELLLDPFSNPSGLTTAVTLTGTWLLEGEDQPQEDGPLTSSAVVAAIEGTISVVTESQIILDNVNIANGGSQTVAVPNGTHALMLLIDTATAPPNQYTLLGGTTGAVYGVVNPIGPTDAYRPAIVSFEYGADTSVTIENTTPVVNPATSITVVALADWPAGITPDFPYLGVATQEPVFASQLGSAGVATTDIGITVNSFAYVCIELTWTYTTVTTTHDLFLRVLDCQGNILMSQVLATGQTGRGGIVKSFASPQADPDWTGAYPVLAVACSGVVSSLVGEVSVVVHYIY
jgi:hypothetical protein